MSDGARLAQRFSACLYSVSSVGRSMRLLGTWMEDVPSRIGSHLLLDRAVACIVSGHEARHCRGSDAAMCLARHRYGEALLLLRDTVAEGRNSVSVDVIAATKLLMTFE